MKTITGILAFLCLTLVVAAQNPHCHSVKKNGDSCRSTFVLKSGLCRAHDTSIARCGDGPEGGRNAKGQPCRQPVQNPGDHCRFHPRKS